MLHSLTRNVEPLPYFFGKVEKGVQEKKFERGNVRVLRKHIKKRSPLSISQKQVGVLIFAEHSKSNDLKVIK